MDPENKEQERFIQRFEQIEITHIPQKENKELTKEQKDLIRKDNKNK